MEKDFPLDLKSQRTEDDISVVASDIKEERSQPSFSNKGRGGILPFVSITKHEKGYLAFQLYFFNGIQNYFLNIILDEMVLPSDDDVVAVVTKPKPRTNTTKPWEGVAPNFS